MTIPAWPTQVYGRLQSLVRQGGSGACGLVDSDVACDIDCVGDVPMLHLWLEPSHSQAAAGRKLQRIELAMKTCIKHELNLLCTYFACLLMKASHK